MAIMNFNDILETSLTGPPDKAITNTFYGLNYAQATPPLPSEQYGRSFIFFTRPMLNLTTLNIANVRKFYPLLSTNPLTMERFVRTTLDPRLQHDLSGPFIDKKNPDTGSSIFSNEVLDSPLCDSNQGFIPILSNSILTLSGVPDVVVPHVTTSAGMRREQYAMVDGTYEVNDVFEMTATFRNIKSGVIPFMFQMWTMYEAAVFEGTLAPYVDFILENEVDYNTRIYILITDKTNRYVSQIFATGASFPNSVPLGKYFDYNRNEVTKENNKTTDIKFVCMGGMYNDPILKHEFNLTQCVFNPDYRDYYLNNNKDAMIEVNSKLLPYVNYRSYPLIDLDTNELKWLVSPHSVKLNRLVKQGFFD